MQPTIALLASIGMLSSLAACLPVQADPPHWAPAYGYRANTEIVTEYRYVYYPAQQVYYAPATQSWFWLSGGNWQVGLSLPLQFQAYVASGGVPIVLNSSRPYTQHVYVEERYGRPWREQHRHDVHWRNDDRGYDHNDRRNYERGPDRSPERSPDRNPERTHGRDYDRKQESNQERNFARGPDRDGDGRRDYRR